MTTECNMRRQSIALHAARTQCSIWAVERGQIPIAAPFTSRKSQTAQPPLFAPIDWKQLQGQLCSLA